MLASRKIRDPDAVDGTAFIPSDRIFTGTSADRIQILNLDDHGKSSNDLVNSALMSSIKSKVETVAVEIRVSHFECPHGHSSEAAYDDWRG